MFRLLKHSSKSPDRSCELDVDRDAFLHKPVRCIGTIVQIYLTFRHLNHPPDLLTTGTQK